jgi:hypothetical protein
MPSLQAPPRNAPLTRAWNPHCGRAVIRRQMSAASNVRFDAFADSSRTLRKGREVPDSEHTAVPLSRSLTRQDLLRSKLNSILN